MNKKIATIVIILNIITICVLGLGTIFTLSIIKTNNFTIKYLDCYKENTLCECYPELKAMLNSPIRRIANWHSQSNEELIESFNNQLGGCERA